MKRDLGLIDDDSFVFVLFCYCEEKGENEWKLEKTIFIFFFRETQELGRQIFDVLGIFYVAKNTHKYTQFL